MGQIEFDLFLAKIGDLDLRRVSELVKIRFYLKTILVMFPEKSRLFFIDPRRVFERVKIGLLLEDYSQVTCQIEL